MVKRADISKLFTSTVSGSLPFVCASINLHGGRVVCSHVGFCIVNSVSYSMVLLYIRGLDFLAKSITPKPASQYHPGSLAVLVRYTQAQKCLRYNSKYLQ